MSDENKYINGGYIRNAPIVTKDQMRIIFFIIRKKYM